MFLYCLAIPCAVALMATRSSKQKKSPKKKSPTLLKNKAKSPRRGDISKASKNKYPVLRCFTFDPLFRLEAYIYEKADGTGDGFMHNIRAYCNRKLECKEIDHLNLVDCNPRREPGTDQIMCNKGTQFWRNVIVRYPIDEGDNDVPSDKETRKQGLQTLKSFFLNEEYTRYAPDNITLKDETDVPNYDPPALDMYFTDYAIRKIMEKHINEDELNENFVSRWPELAAKCWSGDKVSSWARTLGFPIAKKEEKDNKNIDDANEEKDEDPDEADEANDDEEEEEDNE